MHFAYVVRSAHSYRTLISWGVSYILLKYCLYLAPVLSTQLNLSCYVAYIVPCSNNSLLYTSVKNLFCVVCTAWQPGQFLKLCITTRSCSYNALNPHPGFPYHIFPNLLVMQSDLWLSLYVGTCILISPWSDLVPALLHACNSSLMLFSAGTCLLTFPCLLCPAAPESLFIVSFSSVVETC